MKIDVVAVDVHGRKVRRGGAERVHVEGGSRGAHMRGKREKWRRRYVGWKHDGDNFGREERYVRIFLDLIPCKINKFCMRFSLLERV